MVAGGKAGDERSQGQTFRPFPRPPPCAPEPGQTVLSRGRGCTARSRPLTGERAGGDEAAGAPGGGESGQRNRADTARGRENVPRGSRRAGTWRWGQRAGAGEARTPGEGGVREPRPGCALRTKGVRRRRVQWRPALASLGCSFPRGRKLLGWKP